jgi:3-oxoacyl-[acyl-carrier-protein] synthase II
VLGATYGGMWDPRSDPATRPYAELATAPIHTAPVVVAAVAGWQGPNLPIASACASSIQAFGVAADLLADDACDVALAGGTDAALVPYMLDRLDLLRVLAARPDDPSKACRPFDVARTGCVVGEGAVVCVLERLDDARGRGVRPYAVVAGTATNADAHHLVLPQPDGTGAAACIRQALRRAEVTPADVGLVAAHGTGTVQGDRSEARALRAALGHARPPVTAPKGALGHMMGASGAVNVVTACMALRDGVVPPTANHVTTDPACDIDVVAGTPTTIDRDDAAVCTSFAFGGQNASLVLVPA